MFRPNRDVRLGFVLKLNATPKLSHFHFNNNDSCDVMMKMKCIIVACKRNNKFKETRQTFTALTLLLCHSVLMLVSI